MLPFRVSPGWPGVAFDPRGDHSRYKHNKLEERIMESSSVNVDVDPTAAGVALDRLQRSVNLATWIKIGRSNPWIQEADGPPFNADSFHECQTLDELKGKLEHGNWSLGTAFTYRDLCLINQVDGGDEWLTIRHGVAFESVTFRLVIEAGEFEIYVGRLLAATHEQCVTLTY